MEGERIKEWRKKRLEAWAKEIKHDDIGKEVIVYGNYKGIIIGLQDGKRWVKPYLRVAKRELVDLKDLTFIE